MVKIKKKTFNLSKIAIKYSQKSYINLKFKIFLNKKEKLKDVIVTNISQDYNGCSGQCSMLRKKKAWYENCNERQTIFCTIWQANLPK